MNSFIHVDFDRFWRTNRVASAIAFFNYISSRYVFSRRAFAFRERLLEWIPERLAEVKFGAMTLARLPEVYMHCSYALTARKHAIKRPLMEQMRRACLEAGVIGHCRALCAGSSRRRPRRDRRLRRASRQRLAGDLLGGQDGVVLLDPPDAALSRHRRGRRVRRA